MMSMSIQVQPRVDGRFTNRPSFSFMNVSCVRPKPYFCVAGERRRPSFPSVADRNLKFEALKRSRRVPHAAELAPAETMEDVLDAEYGEEEPEVAKVVKPMMKPRVVLKFIWMEKNIGLGLDQMIPGHGTVPLSPYFFWPRKDAWEELKTTLEAKPWISQKNMIILLNQATDIINLWQQSGGNLS